MTAKQLQPPNRDYKGYEQMGKVTKIFLAGSIEMGKATDWQAEIMTRMTRDSFKDGTLFFNPRRNDWDPTWEQSLNNPQFFEQVTWELDMIDASNVIFMYLEAGTMSPISLLELGIVVADTQHENVIVVCPDGFWRKGNVDIVCQRYGIPVYTNLETGIIALQNLLQKKPQR